MKLVFFVHPNFLHSQSMPRFATMLAGGMQARGHEVSVWTPQARFFRLSRLRSVKKWMGYVDQFLLFPAEVLFRLRKASPDTLFVFTDQALGPWVPLVAARPHVIHCHDFLALRSALGQVPENDTAWTGRRYQELIYRGYSQGRCFISVSDKTQEELHYFLPAQPRLSEVVYNGLHGNFRPQDPASARSLFGQRCKLDLSKGYLLHVGGNQWYKNRRGVIEIYTAWRWENPDKLPLLLIGKKPDGDIMEAYRRSAFRGDIHFLTDIDDEGVRQAYAGASLFLFPSLAEGFGWPIAEAMACGCPVITTDEAPMSQVAGGAGFLIPRRPVQAGKVHQWALLAAEQVQVVLRLSAQKRQAAVDAGLLNTRRFDTDKALNRIETIYQHVLQISGQI